MPLLYRQTDGQTQTQTDRQRDCGPRFSQSSGHSPQHQSAAKLMCSVLTSFRVLYRERERDRDRDRETERETETQRQRQTETDRETETERQRDRDRETER